MSDVNENGKQILDRAKRAKKTRGRRTEENIRRPEPRSKEVGRDPISDAETNESQTRGEQNGGVTTPQESLSRRPPTGQAPAASRDYLVQSYFDKATNNFVGTVAEIAEIRVTSKNRNDCILEVEERIEDFLDSARHRQIPPPEPIYVREFPKRLEVAISQGLYRRLDSLSKQERVELDQLVTELLTTGVERRHDRRPLERHASTQQPRNNDHHPQQHRQHRHHSQPRRGGNHMGRHSYNDTMQNRENFMEYVRRLEKNDGGKWKK